MAGLRRLKTVDGTNLGTNGTDLGVTFYTFFIYDGCDGGAAACGSQQGTADRREAILDDPGRLMRGTGCPDARDVQTEETDGEGG